MGKTLHKPSGMLFMCPVNSCKYIAFCTCVNVKESLPLDRVYFPSLKNAGPCVSVLLPIPISSFCLTPLYVRELPPVCAGDLWPGGLGMVHCQRLHRRETAHYPRENFLHLWLWWIYSTVLQRKVWNRRLTTYWCKQEGTTSHKTGNGAGVLSVVRKTFFFYLEIKKRERISPWIQYLVKMDKV